MGSCSEEAKAGIMALHCPPDRKRFRRVTIEKTAGKGTHSRNKSRQANPAPDKAGAGLIMIWGKRREIHRFRFFRRQPHQGDTYFMASPPVAELALDQVCSSAAQSRSASFFVHFSFFPEASVVQT